MDRLTDRQIAVGEAEDVTRLERFKLSSPIADPLILCEHHPSSPTPLCDPDLVGHVVGVVVVDAGYQVDDDAGIAQRSSGAASEAAVQEELRPLRWPGSRLG